MQVFLSVYAASKHETTTSYFQPALGADIAAEHDI